MNEIRVTPDNQSNLLARAVFMILMALAYYVTGMVIFIVTIIQFVMVLLNDKPNDRLVIFSRSLGSYMKQIVHFLTFATEEKPFPFSDWPSGD